MGSKNAALFALTLALTALLASVTNALPAPVLEDIHQTSLDLYALGKLDDANRFAVQVERVDEIIDVDDSGENAKLIAERIADVIIMFDVGPTGDVSVNGIPVEAGITSQVQVEAGMVMGVTADGEKVSTAELADAFDVGLVGINVFVNGEIVSDGVVEMTRITIAEEVTEINGQVVVQHDVKQVVVDIHPDGSMLRHKPCAASKQTLEALRGENAESPDLAGAPNTPGHRSSCKMRAFAKWIHHLPFMGKLAFVFLFGLLFGAITFMFARVIVSLFKLARVGQQDQQATPFLAAVVLDEKSMLKKSQDDLPGYTYTSTGYVAVSTKDVVEESQ